MFRRFARYLTRSFNGLSLPRSFYYFDKGFNCSVNQNSEWECIPFELTASTGTPPGPTSNVGTGIIVDPQMSKLLEEKLKEGLDPDSRVNISHFDPPTLIRVICKLHIYQSGVFGDVPVGRIDAAQGWIIRKIKEIGL
jgi:hypothetical protein